MPKSTFFNLTDEKRCLILNLAIEEFAENDYKNASVSNIVARAGIAKGSLYQYFDDKRDLYLYLIQMAGDEKKKFLSQRPPPDPSMNVFDFLRWLMQEGTHFELSNPLLARVAYRALFSDRPFGDEPFADLRKLARDYYISIVQMGIDQGVINPNYDRELVVFLFSTVFNAFGAFIIEQQQIDLQALASGEVSLQALPVADLSEQVIEILQGGLSSRLS
jgi:AcrR family transcriptional regulator